MALSTFGAIMAFAGKIVTQTEDAHKLMAPKTNNTLLKEALQILLTEADKNRTLIEEARRLYVTEMILEPVTGLRLEDYDMDIQISDKGRDVDILEIALILEKRERGFFQDASSRIPLPEVARFFRKIMQKKDKNIARLGDIHLQ
jgi:hypothetical protein